MFFNKLFSNSSTNKNEDNNNNNGVETVISNLDTTSTTDTNTNGNANEEGGGLFSNTFKKFGNSLGNKDTFKKFGSTISVFTSNVIQKFDDERKKLIEESSDTNANDKNGSGGGNANDLLLPPWLDFKVESNDKQKEILEKLLDIKMSRKTFLSPPPIDADYCQEFDSFLIAIAKISLSSDPLLEKIRFHLVPSKISEEQFWKHWYYRITLIKKQYNLQLYSNLKDLINYQKQLISDHKSGNSPILTSTTATNNNNNSNDNIEVEKILKEAKNSNDSTISPKSTDIEKWEKELQSELESFNINDLSLNYNDLDEDWGKINMELESNTDVLSTPTVLQIDSDHDLITSNNDSDIELELEKELMKIKEFQASQEILNSNNNTNTNNTTNEELIKEIENELSQFQREEEEELQLSKKD